MNETSLHTLVNFRASKLLLESFDRVCFLSGKTRTQVLAEMMRNRVTKAGPKLAIKAAADKVVFDRLKTAVESRSQIETVEGRRTWSSAVRGRLKPFSSFPNDGGR